MRFGAIPAACLAAALAAVPAAWSSDDLPSQTLGNWVTERNEAVIQISVGAGGALEGRVLSPVQPAAGTAAGDGRKAGLAPADTARRDGTAHGELILTGMNYDGAGSWSGGIIRDPRNGHCYHAYLQLIDAEHLHVRGFIGLALFGRTQVWKRYHGSL